MHEFYTGQRHHFPGTAELINIIRACLLPLSLLLFHSIDSELCVTGPMSVDPVTQQSLPIDDIVSLQDSLTALLDRIEEVQADHEKLSGEKSFLEDYIGNLMVKLTQSRRTV